MRPTTCEGSGDAWCSFRPWDRSIRAITSSSAPLAAKGSLLVHAEMLDDGYRLEAWLRRDQLQGFDPVADREAGTPTRLGFYFVIRDSELGDQTLSVDDRFPFAYDPSLWGTLELDAT